MHLQAKQRKDELTDELRINLKTVSLEFMDHWIQKSKQNFFFDSGCKPLICIQGLLKIYHGMLLRAKLEEGEDRKYCSVTSLGEDREVGQRGWHE